MRNIIFAEMKTAYLWYNIYFSAEKETTALQHYWEEEELMSEMLVSQC